jgi:ribokinase
MYDVISVGSAVLDVLVKSKSFKLIESHDFAGGVAVCEAYEGKMEADEIEIVSGGGGTNNAVSFARKGLKTAVIAEMGADLSGKMVSAELIRERVDTRFLVVEEGEVTGVSVILVSSEGGRSIVTYRGASRMLTHKDIPLEKLRTRWLHISSLGGRLALLEELCGWARKNKVKVAVNPGKMEIRQKKRLWECIRDVEVLIINREEASLLTGTDYLDMKVFRSDACLAGPKVNVITAGRDGGKVCAEGKRLFYKGSTRVKRVSSLGAGDAFGSGFVAALIYDKSLEGAIEWARRNAESVLGYLSAKKGLLRLSELQIRSERSS